MKKYQNAIKLMNKKFKKDSLIGVATVNEAGKPVARMINAYFEEADNSFYAVTHAQSNKMVQIEASPEVAVCSEGWFTGLGVGENLGWVNEEKNAAMMKKLRTAFAKWYSDGHIDEEDHGTCLLRIRLTNGILIEHSPKYEEYRINFTQRTIQLLSTSSPSSVIEYDGMESVVYVVNPCSWAIVHLALGAYAGKKVKITFSADVKRLGAGGRLNWQINLPDYPSLAVLEDAAPDTWHTLSGEWTGILDNRFPALYLSTHENNSDITTYLVSNFEADVKSVK
ncbi:MAG: pyridoxamine 5'-phosphate oxidase family protein [Defluviitaleaceae bacterium]|nr:pyridoxamine 5'-phosphate oxidase family protein [Defluviitaleaceae bacterium]